MKNNILWLKSETAVDEIDRLISANGGHPRYFRVDTSSAGTPEHDLMKIALRDSNARELLTNLTNLGFSLYYNSDNESRFIRYDRIVHHWPAVKDGTFTTSEDGVVHILEEPKTGQYDRLVVVFSPINSTPRLARYFRPSFATLKKYLPPNTGILRIADVGGVKGAFYLDTTFLSDNSARIQRFIRSVLTETGVSDNNVVLYGASKGGTGALYHGLRGGWKFVATDPVLSDEWYEREKDDYHFTGTGIFPRPKQEVFADLISRSRLRLNRRGPASVIVTSSRSPQFAYTSQLIRPIRRRISVLDSGNPEIHEHPDVAPKTIYLQVMALNALLLGFGLGTGVTPVP